MSLKPQDVMVVLKLCTYPSGRPSFSQVGLDLGMSPSEVHGAVRRLEKAHLVNAGPGPGKPNISALEEFLIHGVKYSFPAERGEMTRGVATSYAAEPLRHQIAAGDEPPPVWPYAEGGNRGASFAPLYKTAPFAALRDPLLYEYLALVDAIRGGRIRERALAEQELLKRLHQLNGKSKSGTPHKRGGAVKPTAR